MKKKIRPLGDITFDLEDVITEMIEDHELQHGEVMAIVLNYMKVHFPESQEEYEDGTSPVYYYGHKKYVNRVK